MVGGRLIQLVVVLFILSVVIFVLMKLAPGDPVTALLHGDEMSTTLGDEDQLREELGFHRPLHVQYGEWLFHVIQLDLGYSLLKNKPVIDELWSRLPATLELAAGGLMVMMIIAVPLGLLAARFPRRFPDHFSRLFTLFGASLPLFWIGLIFIYCFSLKLDWFPTMGRGGIEHLVLPALTLGFGLAAVHARLLRSGMLESLSSEYVRAARARGLSELRVYVKYAMRSALVPVLTIFGMTAGSLVCGSVVVETIFSWPGLGSMATEAIFQRDYPLIQGYLLMAGTFIMIVNLIVDIVCRWVDPRLRLLGGERE